MLVYRRLFLADSSYYDIINVGFSTTTQGRRKNYEEKDKGTIEKAMFVQIELAILNSSGKNIPIKKTIEASTNK